MRMCLCRRTQSIFAVTVDPNYRQRCALSNPVQHILWPCAF